MLFQPALQASPLHWLRYCARALLAAAGGTRRTGSGSRSRSLPADVQGPADGGQRRHRSAHRGRRPGGGLATRLQATRATCGSHSRCSSRRHTVVVPDLRGMGLSSHPEDGYTKVARAHDLIAILDQLQIGEFTLVTHDIGNMVGYATAAQNSDAGQRLGHHGCAPARSGKLGQAVDEIPRSGTSTSAGPMLSRLVAVAEHPAGSVLQRVVGESGPHRRADTAPLGQRLHARPGAIHNAFGGHARRVRDRCGRQQCAVREDRQAADAHSRASVAITRTAPRWPQRLDTVASNVRGAVIYELGTLDHGRAA